MKFLSNKEKKQLNEKLNINLEFEKKDELKIDNENIYYLNGEKFLINISENKKEEILIPHLNILQKKESISNEFPSVYIDRGAIPFILKGADLMRPGITKVIGNFKDGDLILIKDEEHKKILAIGKSLYENKELEKLKSGKVIKVIHYFNDKYF